MVLLRINHVRVGISLLIHKMGDRLHYFSIILMEESQNLSRSRKASEKGTLCLLTFLCLTWNTSKGNSINWTKALISSIIQGVKGWESHVFFVDNLLLFYKAEVKSIQMLHGAFTRFSKASGLQDNTKVVYI